MTATHLSANTIRATQAFVARVAQVYPTQQAILFGSRARGTAHEENDADAGVDGQGTPRSRQCVPTFARQQ